ncbi:MAG: aldo/keto reductase [Opitutaceae bacterium]
MNPNPCPPPSGHFARPTALSALGLGCVTFGREIDRTAAFAMMNHAAASGMTTFDTAAAYADGDSERIVGEWLAAHRGARAGLTLATKLLPPYAADRLAQGVGESLSRLGTDYLDLLFLHQWDESALNPATLMALDTLVRSGRVRALGASNFSAEQLAQIIDRQSAAGYAPIYALQNIHNLAVRGFDDSLRELCARCGIALIGYSPLGAGFLTGKHRVGVAPGSRFAIIPGHQAIYFNPAAQRRLGRLEAAAKRTGLPMAHLALAWALHQPQLSTVLVGGRNPAQLDQALAAQRFNDPALFRELANE